MKLSALIVCASCSGFVTGLILLCLTPLAERMRLERELEAAVDFFMMCSGRLIAVAVMVALVSLCVLAFAMVASLPTSWR